jgi:hypothetical protein
MPMILKENLVRHGGASPRHQCATVRATNAITRTRAFSAKTGQDKSLMPESTTGGAV